MYFNVFTDMFVIFLSRPIFDTILLICFFFFNKIFKVGAETYVGLET